MTEVIHWNLETREIKDLVFHWKNPRRLSTHDANHLSKSITKYGLIDKPIITQSGNVIGGHQRLSILKKLKYRQVECWVPDRELSQSEIDELNIKLNRAQGEWNWDILANDWNIDDLVDFGFTPEELASAPITDVESEDEEGETLEPGKDEAAITKSGDVLLLGDHRLVCGDSCDPSVVKSCLASAEPIPILMVTDPPYGVKYDPGWRKKHNKRKKDGFNHTATGKVQNDDQVNWALAWHLFPGSVAYVWCASWFLPEIAKDLEEAEFERKSLIIWVKQHFNFSRGDYHWKHEACWYAVKKGCNHNWQGSRKESTVWEIESLHPVGKTAISEREERTPHSTQKPLECMARPIRNNTAEGQGVYDPFLGSGTTLIAAEQLNRICYGIEISPAYCDIIVKRWMKFRLKCEKETIVMKNGEVTEEFN